MKDFFSLDPDPDPKRKHGFKNFFQKKQTNSIWRVTLMIKKNLTSMASFGRSEKKKLTKATTESGIKEMI